MNYKVSKAMYRVYNPTRYSHVIITYLRIRLKYVLRKAGIFVIQSDDLDIDGMSRPVSTPMVPIY